MEIHVPCGTLVSDDENDLAFDLLRDGERMVCATGGTGGRGNRRFRSATRQAPRFADRGLPGSSGWFDLRLKLLADVALVGLPNAGKSSLLRRLSNATPKVADYPFTTIEPALGTVELGDHRLTLADVPGLIAGASEGVGLGHEFLAHVERTKFLVHVVESAPADGTDPYENFTTIERELALHGPELADRTRIVALSKSDLLPREECEAVAGAWAERDVAGYRTVVAVSSVTGSGLRELKERIFASMPQEPPADISGASENAPAEYRLYRPGLMVEFSVDRDADGVLRVVGPAIDRLMARTDTENEEALEHLERRLRAMGVVKALESAGFKSGSDIRIGDREFEFDPG